ncbi:MAG: type II toxin-antitoxin system VapC family toxin, partial [Actinomycetota bacterium]
EGSDLAADVWDGADLRVTSRLAYPEARAALAAASRTRRLATRALGLARRGLDDRWEQLYRIDASDRLVLLAGDLAEEHSLRGFDAVHLASAVEAGNDDALVLATWDRELARAAVDRGLGVAPDIAGSS